jgi:hypothetical protein
MKAGAKVDVINSHNHGAVEICALKQYIEMLEYLIKLENPKIPVWKNLIKFLSSESEEEAEASGKCLELFVKLLQDWEFHCSEQLSQHK